MFCDFNKIKPDERSIVWMMFNNKEYMNLFNDWASHAQGILARFRAACGRHTDDDWFTAFINRIKAESPSFNEW